MAVTQSEKGFNIDVPLPEALQEFLAKPRCADISLPEPGSVSLQLPTGGTIKGIGDVTQGIPTNCSLNFSLLLQLGPILANLECFIRVLKVIKPLIDVIKGLPFPPVEAIKDFGEAAQESDHRHARTLDHRPAVLEGLPDHQRPGLPPHGGDHHPVHLGHQLAQLGALVAARERHVRTLGREQVAERLLPAR